MENGNDSVLTLTFGKGDVAIQFGLLEDNVALVFKGLMEPLAPGTVIPQDVMDEAVPLIAIKFPDKASLERLMLGLQTASNSYDDWMKIVKMHEGKEGL